MTEEDWLKATYPQPLLSHLKHSGGLSPRKARLFACECWRRVWPALTNVDRNGVMLAERFADGLASTVELGQVYNGNGQTSEPYVCYPATPDAFYAANLAAEMCADAVSDVNDESDSDVQFDTERMAQVILLREIFGNPFRPATLDPNYLTPPVRTLAASIYEERAFDRLPILADLLEEAGCNQDEVLKHLRGTGVRVRGDWALDLVLGKE